MANCACSRLSGAMSTGALIAVAVILMSYSVLPTPSEAAPVGFARDHFKAADGLCDGLSDGACTPSFRPSLTPAVSHLFMDKPLYRPGEVARFRVWAFDAVDNSLARMSRRRCSWKVLDPSESVLVSRTSLRSGGTDYDGWRIPEHAKGGQYKLTAVCGDLPKAEHTFHVRAFRNPELNIGVDFLQDSYGAGDTVTAIVAVSRADGSPLSSNSLVSGSAHVSLLRGFESAVEIPQKGAMSGSVIVSFKVTDQDITGDGSLHIVAEDGGTFEAVVIPIPLVGSAVSLDFTPEGRTDLLAGVENRVFFSASDFAGNAVDFEGQLFEDCPGFDARPLSIAIESEHEGRGACSLQPRRSCSYYAEVTRPASISGRFSLPPVAERGATISLLTDPSDLVAGGTVSAQVVSVGDSDDTLEMKLFRKGLNLTSVEVQRSSEAELRFPDGLFGVMRLALFVNDKYEAERLIFVRPAPTTPLSVDVTAGRDLYLPGEEASVTVKVTDSEGRPVQAAVAITVTDESGWQLTPLDKRPSRLPEGVLLSDEVAEDLGGSVRLPSFYESAGAPAGAYDQLDLLLGTQKWRKLAYKEPFQFMDELDDFDKARRMLGIPPRLQLLKSAPVMMAFAGGDGAVARGGVFGGIMETSATVHLEMAEAAAPPDPADSRFETPQLDRNRRQQSLQHSIPEQASPFAHAGPTDGLSRGERFDWTQTVYWSSAEETDENGEVAVSFRTSHSMTTVRVMVDAVLVEMSPSSEASVVAAPAAAFGASTVFFSVREPLYLEPKLPHHLVAGDRAFIPLSVNNRGDNHMSPLVTLSHIGHGLNAPDAERNLAIPGDIAGGETTRLLLDVTADKRAPLNFFDGTHASLSLSVHDVDEVYSDTVSRLLHILPEGVPVTSDASGTFPSTPDESILVNLDEARTAFAEGDVVEGSISGELKVYPSPLTSLMEAVVALLRKPCGCFEQTSSSHFPNIMIADFMQSMGLEEGEHAPFFAKTLQHLEEGYQRLVGYETDLDGFEWFGASPPHEALTAYGLLEFSAMKKLKGVHVSDALLTRTRDLLLGLREGDGFHKNPRAMDSFGRAPRQVTTAYIVWAMSQSGVDVTMLEEQLSGLVTSIREELQQGTANPYVLALLVDSLYNFGRVGDAEEFGDHLMAAFDSDGVLNSRGRHATITMSGGASLEVEIASVAALAMMHDPHRYVRRIHACMQQVLSRCKNGAFGSTQATVLGLRAIIAYWKLVGTANNDCQTTVMVGSSQHATFSPAEGVPPLGPSIMAALQSGDDLTLVSECKNLMFSTSVQWRRKSVPEPTLPAFSFSTSVVQDGELAETDPLFLSVEWCNESPDDTAMLLASVGVPGGVDVDTAFLDLAVSKGDVDYYELASDSSELFLYWRGSQAGQCSTLTLPAIATVPGTYSAVPSHFYQYYDEERQVWQEPLSVAIAPIQ